VARKLLSSGSWISDEYVLGSPPLHDNEMPAAEPSPEMGDRGQRAGRHGLIGGDLYSLRLESEGFGEARQCQEIRTVGLCCRLVDEALVDQWEAVVGGDRRERSKAAVVASSLADDCGPRGGSAREPAAQVQQGVS